MLNVMPYIEIAPIINLCLVLLGVSFGDSKPGAMFGALLLINVVLTGVLYLITL